MKIGRVVYRSDVGEPLLVAAMLFQIGTGLFLAWRWSAAAPTIVTAAPDAGAVG